MNTRGGDHRVLKAEAVRPDATRAASTETEAPFLATTGGTSAGKLTNAEKVTTGNGQTAPQAAV